MDRTQLYNFTITALWSDFGAKIIVRLFREAKKKQERALCIFKVELQPANMDKGASRYKVRTGSGSDRLNTQVLQRPFIACVRWVSGRSLLLPVL